MTLISLNRAASTSEHWAELRNYFIDRILVGFLFLAIFGLPISLLRSLSYGWRPVYLTQIIIAIVFILLYLLRNRVSFPLKSGILVFNIFILAMAGLTTFGLSGGGVPFLLLLQFLIGSIYRPRIALIWFIFTFALFVMVGIAFHSGALQLIVDLNIYTTNLAAWGSVWILFGVIGVVAFRAMGVVQYTLLSLLQEVEKQRDEINHLANHDHLTGLPTMRLAQDRLEIAIRHAERHQEKVAVLFIDLDGFRKINDDFGHDCGDQALKETSRRMSSIVRAEDTVARRSGDEFLVILGSLTEDKYISDIARRIISEISQPISHHGLTFALGASVGISIFPDHTRDIEELKNLADQAMYSVKNAQKNGFAFATGFNPTEAP